MRHRLLRISLALAAIGTAAGTGAAAPPATLNHLTALNTDPTEQQRREIEEYAAQWAERMRSTDPAVVWDARKRLEEPLNTFNVSLIFRANFGKALIPQLRPVVQDKTNPHSAYNALLVLSRLTTVDGLEAMVRHVDLRDEPREAMRLAAARGIRAILGEAKPDELPPRDRAAPVRALAQAAKKEPSAKVVQHQLDAIAFSVKLDDLRQAELFEAFDGVLDTMEARAEAAEFMAAVRPTILAMRGLFLSTRTQTPGTLADRIMPRLHRLLAIAQKHWDTVESDPSRLSAYQGTIETAESLLHVLATATSRPLGQTRLVESYGRNLQLYSADLRRIELVLPR
jgi:hypothetical protein